MMGYLSTWWEYLIGKAKGEQRIWEIAPGLFTASEIREPSVLKAKDIKVVIDLEGSFDEGVADFLTAYLYWPIEDKAELPDLTTLENVATFALWMWNNGTKVLIH